MRTSIALLVAAFCAVAGCQTFRPHPLTQKAVDESLARPSNETLTVAAGRLRHPLLKPIRLNLGDGISPDEAAVVAVLVNPSLKAERDRRGLAAAQALSAGILPNPELGANVDVPAFGTLTDTVTGFGLGPTWDFTSLLGRSAREAAAAKSEKQVDLEVAWREWEVAQRARAAVYDAVTADRRIALAQSIETNLHTNLTLVQKAVDAGQLTGTHLAAAQAAYHQAAEDLAALRQQAEEARLALDRVLGFSPDAHPRIEKGLKLPDRLDPPASKELLRGLASRRLDLVALRRGYESREESLRAAILDQFPRISFGPTLARDTGNVGTGGFGLTIGLPIFDRNQGAIARERATRKMLFDEYADRLYETRADVARLLALIHGLDRRIAAARAAESALEHLVSTYKAAMSRGQADALSYYTALGDLNRKKIEILNLEGALAGAGLRLELAAAVYDIDFTGHGKGRGRQPR